MSLQCAIAGATTLATREGELKISSGQINDRNGAAYHWFGLVMIRQQKFRVAEYAFRCEAIRLKLSDVTIGRMSIFHVGPFIPY